MTECLHTKLDTLGDMLIGELCNELLVANADGRYKIMPAAKLVEGYDYVQSSIQQQRITGSLGDATHLPSKYVRTKRP